MSFLSIQAMGRNRETPRLWIESQRLDALGFRHGVALEIETRTERLVLRPTLLGENHVSSRVTAVERRPIIDLENRSLLSGLAEYSEVKIIASFERIEVTPSVRAFAIQRSRTLTDPLRVLEVGRDRRPQALVAHRDLGWKVRRNSTWHSLYHAGVRAPRSARCGTGPRRCPPHRPND